MKRLAVLIILTASSCAIPTVGPAPAAPVVEDIVVVDEPVDVATSDAEMQTWLCDLAAADPDLTAMAAEYGFDLATVCR